MSHEISMFDGKGEMFSGNNIAPWHQKETNSTVVSGTLNAKDAIEAAHLGWQVKSEPVILADGRNAKDYQLLSRADNRAVLSIMKQRYEIIQNQDCFDFLDLLAGQDAIRYETAGALRGGRQIWLMAKYDGETVINGDEHRQWLLAVNSHDGSYSLMVQWVTERVVCANTLSIALKSAKNQVKIRHTANWQNKADEAKRVLQLTQNYFKEAQSSLNGMNRQPMTVDNMARFARVLYPAKDETDVPTRTRNIRTDLVTLFQRGQGNRGQSRWDALCAVTDFADHVQTIRGENSNRLETSLLASGAQLKQRAFELLTDNHEFDKIIYSN